MFTVKTKSKIPRTESYPLKASEVSEALSRVAQAKLLEIRFWRYVRTQDRDRKVWPLVALTYSRVRVGISTSNDWIAEGWLGAELAAHDFAAAEDNAPRHQLAAGWRGSSEIEGLVGGT
jgi:hypothetical protein